MKLFAICWIVLGILLTLGAAYIYYQEGNIDAMKETLYQIFLFSIIIYFLMEF